MANPFQDSMMRRLNIIGSMGEMPVMPQRQQMTQQQTGGATGFSGPTGPMMAGEKGLIQFGKWLQSRGFRVSEHPAFGGVEPVHTRNSDHYRGHAIDVNWAPGTSLREQRAIDAILKYAGQYGLRYIWRAPGHYNHAHFYFR